ncbi:MAG: ABC transporter permease [Chloroflexi bacterium]|nr:ABC transporter permease [Chloroflexota bacterium]
MAGPAHPVQLAPPPVEPARRAAPSRTGRLQRLWRRYPGLAIGGTVIVLIVLAALLAPLVSPRDPSSQSLLRRLSAPGANGYLLGADEFGRDILSRLLWGSRISLVVGLLAVGVGAVVGQALGLLAGFYRGWVDAAVVRLLDVLLTFPPILLAIAIVAAAGSGVTNVIAAIALTNVPRFARVVRASTLSARETEYVNAARVLGASDWRIVARHIVPNILSPVIIIATLNIGAAILTEASLSFLGLGVAPPTPTWGGMIQAGTQQLERAPWIALSAGVAIMLTVLGFNLLGDGVRDALDPRLAER